MSTRRKTNYIKMVLTLSVLVAVLVSGVAGCGDSGTNNDQGTSFMAIGYYDDAAGTVGRNGDSIPLYADVSPLNFDGMAYYTWMGITNRLSRQFIRIVRIDCNYHAEGSFIKIPSDSFAFSTVLGPAAGTAEDANPANANLPSTSYAGFQLLSPDIFTFLNNNRTYLPSLPFRMIATCSATGVTQAGNTMTTNPLNFFFQFVDTQECCTGTGPGFQIGTGTGGDFN